MIRLPTSLLFVVVQVKAAFRGRVPPVVAEGFDPRSCPTCGQMTRMSGEHANLLTMWSLPQTADRFEAATQALNEHRKAFLEAYESHFYSTGHDPLAGSHLRPKRLVIREALGFLGPLVMGLLLFVLLAAVSKLF